MPHNTQGTCKIPEPGAAMHHWAPAEPQKGFGKNGNDTNKANEAEFLNVPPFFPKRLKIRNAHFNKAGVVS